MKLASAVQTSIQYLFEFTTGLKGYHIYKNTKNQRPFVGQEISFKKDLANERDHFSMSGKVLLPNKLLLEVISHTLQEIGRDNWHAILNGGLITGKVENAKLKVSSLVQSGPEIIVHLEVQWSRKKLLNIFKAKVKEGAYPTNQECVDNSKNILYELFGL